MKVMLTTIIVLVVAVVAGVAMFGSGSGEWSGIWRKQSEVTAVRIGYAEHRTLIETISAPGEIVPRTKVDVSAQTMARVIELPFRHGDHVRAGDVVVRLDDRDLQAALLSVIARRDGELYRLQADEHRLTGLMTTRDLARRTLERYESLYQSQDISQSALDEARQRVEDLEAQLRASKQSLAQAESGLAAAEAEIRRAEEAVRNTVIESPISGKVAKLNAEVGEMVVTGTMNNPGTVIMTIADLDHMMMKARVAEADIAGAKEGQPAKVHIIAFPDHVFEGVVSNIALQRSGDADGTGYFETEIDIELDGHALRSGLNANVDIEISATAGIVVPSQAIVDRPIDDLPAEVLGDDSIVDRTKSMTRVVFRVIDGKAVATPVQIGTSDLTHTLVTAGLDEAEAVIVGPYKVLAEIKHGTSVRDLNQKEAVGEDADNGEEAVSISASSS